MASSTPKQGLRKPDLVDLVNVLTDLDANFDSIDRMSSGELEVQEITVGPAAFTGATDIIVGDPITTIANQRLLIMFDMIVQSTVANDLVQITIQEGATVFKTFFCECTRAGIAYPSQGFVRKSGLAAGAHTIKVVAQRISGAGNITVPVSVNAPGQLLIVDLGQA